MDRDVGPCEVRTMQVNKAVVMLAAVAILVSGTAAQDESVKLGIVDLDQAIFSTEAGKAAREELVSKQREADAKLQPLYERYRTLEEDFKAKKFVLSEEALFQKQLDLTEMRNQIEGKTKELEGQMQVDQKRIQGPLISKLSDIVNEVGKYQGFSMIFHRRSQVILYVREALDITDLVIERYDQKS